MRALFVFLLTLTGGYAKAEGIPSAYHAVANKFNIPVKILYAIALTESGQHRSGIWRPWPWSLNVEGRSHRYQTIMEAHEKLVLVNDGGQHADIGLMQINSYWHATRVDRITDLLNPYINLEVGAQILMEQYQRSSKDWWLVVGRYHTPASDVKSLARAQRYRQRVRKNYNRIEARNNE